MYEQYFGLSGRAFAITPDPDFYFDSHGHRRALAYLRHGVLDGECFMVMTGEIGAGKTLLIQKLLRELKSKPIVPALLVNTQLDQRNLLIAVLRAFGMPAMSESVEELQADLEAFLASLRAGGKRALVIVDEAQNLSPDAIAQVAFLSQLQAAGSAPLQVLLAGQPELRGFLQHDLADTAHRPVFVFCHVGLLTKAEARGYVEHRLRRVGWRARPAFADEAYEAIYRVTDGVPRRINRLCERVLTAAGAEGAETISAELVERAHAELSMEVGEAVPLAQPVPLAELLQRPPPVPVAAPAPTMPTPVPVPLPLPVVNGSAAMLPEPAQPAMHSELRSPYREPRVRREGQRVAVVAAAVAGLALAWLMGWWTSRGDRIAEPALAAAMVAAPASVAAAAAAPIREAVRRETAVEPAAKEMPPTAAGPVATQTVPALPPGESPAPTLPAAPAPTVPDRAAAPSAASQDRAAAPPLPAPAPVAGPCTATVAALGLCTLPKNPLAKEAS